MFLGEDPALRHTEWADTRATHMREGLSICCPWAQDQLRHSGFGYREQDPGQHASRGIDCQLCSASVCVLVRVPLFRGVL